MKYIDAEKLIAEIDKILAKAEKDEKKAFYKKDAAGHLIAVTKTAICVKIKKLITSLQQEQPIGEEYAIEIGKETHTLRVGSQSDINRLIAPDRQEQPEVDLNALVDEAFDKYSSVDGYGQLSVSFNRAELYSFIKKITRKEE